MINKILLTLFLLSPSLLASPQPEEDVPLRTYADSPVPWEREGDSHAQMLDILLTLEAKYQDLWQAYLSAQVRINQMRREVQGDRSPRDVWQLLASMKYNTQHQQDTRLQTEHAKQQLTMFLDSLENTLLPRPRERRHSS